MVCRFCADCGKACRFTRCKACRDRRSYLKHRDSRLARAKTYRERPGVKRRNAKYHREYARHHQDSIRGYKRKYQSTSDYRKMYHRLSQRLRDGLRLYSKTGKIQRSSKYGINYRAIIDHLGPCPGEWRDWHIDHIRPLKSFDLNEHDQVRQAFAAENLRWLPAKENLSKGCRPVQEA